MVGLGFFEHGYPRVRGRFWERLDTKEVDQKVEESGNRARASPCLDDKLSTLLRWYWAREE